MKKLLDITTEMNLAIKELSIVLTRQKGERVTESQVVEIAVQKLLEESRNQ